MVNNIAQLKKIYDSKTRSAQNKGSPENEMTKIKMEAYENGFAAGKKEAIIEAAQRQELIQKEIIYNLQLCIEKYLSNQISFQADLSNLILDLSLSLFKKTFPVYAKKTGISEISSFIEIQLQKLKSLPELIITVHPDNLKDIQSMCQKIVSDNNLKVQISVKESSELELSDCIINWEHGYVEKKLNNILDTLSLAASDLTQNHVNE